MACVVPVDRPGATERVRVLLESMGGVIEAELSRGWLVRIDPQATRVLSSHTDVLVAGGVQPPAMRRIRKVVHSTA